MAAGRAKNLSIAMDCIEISEVAMARIFLAVFCSFVIIYNDLFDVVSKLQVARP